MLATLPLSQRTLPLGKRKCENCELATTGRTNCLPGLGPRSARIMIVGDAPLAPDDLEAEPFCGVSGNMLDFLLEGTQIDRERVFVTFAVKCRSLNKVKKDKPPSRKQILACRMHLYEEIKWIKPDVIITMGPTAFQSLSPESGSLESARGFPIRWVYTADGETREAWLLPTFSPMRALKNPDMHVVVKRDLKLAKRIAVGDWQMPDLNSAVQVCTTVEAVERLVEELEEAPTWAFDLETEGLDFTRDGILCFSFGFPDGRSAVIPWLKKWDVGGEDKGTWTDAERKEVLALVRRAFLSPARKTAHNGKFDLGFLRRLTVAIRAFDFDTLLAHALIDSARPHNLLFVGQWYDLVHQQYDAQLEAEFKVMGERNYAKVSSKTLFRYAGVDAAVTAQLRPILEKQMDKAGVTDVFRKISIPLTFVLHSMEYEGARFDRETGGKLAIETALKITQSEETLRRLTNNPKFNPASTKQVREFLQAKKCRLEKMTKSGASFAMDEEVLARLAKVGRAKEFCSALLDLRYSAKLKGTYLDGKDGRGGLLGQCDGRGYIHTSFNIFGAYTGRLSSSDPNLQNIPKRGGIRELFIPDEDEDEFASVDYKQLEVRVAAAITRDPVLIDEIVKGIDMHSRNACFVWRYNEDEFLKAIKDETHPRFEEWNAKRDAAKVITFGTLYGSSAAGSSTRNDIPVDEADEFIRGFFTKYRILYRWVKDQHKKVREVHRVVTPTGRYAHFDVMDWIRSRYCMRHERKRTLGDLERIAQNMPIQSYGSDVFQFSKIALWKALKQSKLRSRLVLSLHDGALINVKPGEKDRVVELVKRSFDKTLNTGTAFEVPLSVDIKFYPRWVGRA